MTDLAQLERSLNRGSQKVPAPAVIEIAPSEFASDWAPSHGRPVAPIAFGLRLPSEEDVQTARLQAERDVQALGQVSILTAVEAFNDSLMAVGVARCLCDPLDVRSPHPVLPIAEDTIRQALPGATIRRLYDRIERLQIEQSPLAHEATDAEIELFAYRLLGGEVAEMGVEGRSIRRFVGYCLDLLPEEN